MRGETLAILRRLGKRPDKQLGQNFLIDPGALQQIVRFGNPAKAKHLLEIGPGLGALTRELIAFGPVNAVELDETFANYLEATMEELRLHREDIRGFDFSSLEHPLTVFGNLPYSCTSEIIFTLIDNAQYVERAVVMLQREVAQRLASQPGVKAYGSISVQLQNRAELRLGPIIEPQSFFPEPQVFSQLIEIRMLEAPRFPVENAFFFRRLTQGVFSHRRKKLLNALVSSALLKDYDVAALLSEGGFDAEERPERLSVESFTQLANFLWKHSVGKNEQP